jgi:hypothetical protein
MRELKIRSSRFEACSFWATLALPLIYLKLKEKSENFQIYQDLYLRFAIF